MPGHSNAKPPDPILLSHTFRTIIQNGESLKEWETMYSNGILTKQNIRGGQEYVDALVLAIQYDRLDILEWVHKKFGLTEYDIRKYNHSLFHTAIASNNIRILDWLFNNFTLNYEDKNFIKNLGFKIAREFSTPEIIEWLNKNIGEIETETNTK